MIRIEFYGFGDQGFVTLNEVRNFLSGVSYVETNNVRFCVVSSESIDFGGTDAPFVRLVSDLERNNEFAMIINQNLGLEVEFMLIKKHYL